MSTADIIIVISVALLATVIIGFRFIRKKKTSCSGCSYAKGCDTYCAKIEPKDEEENEI